ncbi:MAG: DUF5752 family protein [Pseudomonadota bacterium]|nr:DUF5752 family protein [Pseudomonadota bacterium]
MTTQTETYLPFEIRDCALISIATGNRAQNLKELRDRLLNVDSSSIYFHFWGALLRPGFESREYNNDFAEWIRHEIHDRTLAERLGVIDPSATDDLEHLRSELIDAIEERLDELRILFWTPPDRQFEFIRSQIIVFRTHRSIEKPEALKDILPRLSASSVFYHFIDAGRRTEDRSDDFSAWLGQWGDEHDELRRRLAGIDPYFISLTELREQLSEIAADYFHQGAEV